MQLMPLLSHPCDEIVYEVLALLKVLLECGNENAQTGLTSLITAKEHTLFPTLQRMLKQSAVAYRERYRDKLTPSFSCSLLYTQCMHTYSQFLIAKMKDRITTDRQLVNTNVHSSCFLGAVYLSVFSAVSSLT